MSTAGNGPIIVVNPNSNQVVTNGLNEELEPFRFRGGPAIECLTLAEGPFGIESQVDSDSIVLPLVRTVRGRPDAGAFVIACYSDPGIDSCRSVSEAQTALVIKEKSAPADEEIVDLLHGRNVASPQAAR